MHLTLVLIKRLATLRITKKLEITFNLSEVNYGGAVYSATKYGVRAIMETLRAEAATDKVHVLATVISPGTIATELLNSITSPDVKNGLQAFYDQVAIKPQSIADAISFAIDEPHDVSVNEIIVRPTDQEV